MVALKRTFTILLALMTIVPSIVPAAAQQPDPDPGEDPAPEPPTPPEQPPEEPPEEPPQPPEEPPQPPDGAPGTPEGPDTTSPRAAYFEETFGNLTGFSQTQLEGDRQTESLWHVEPIGHNGSKAAVLSTSTGLPRGLHQGLASPTVDLTPVPSTVDDPTVTNAAEAGVDRGSRVVQEGVRSGISAADQTSRDNFAKLTQNPVFETGPISLPKGPATLTLLHSFAFDSTRNEQGEAVSGFTVEARTPGGDWVPVEASALARPAHGADAPGPRKQAEDIPTDQTVAPCEFEETAQSVIDDIVAGFVPPSDGFDEDNAPIPYECNEGSISTDVTPEPNEFLITVGDATLQVSTGPAASNGSGPGGDEGTPILPNAYVQPLDQRGFTGVSDTDDDGQAEVVGHTFDLSAWAGERVELRFRAGTSAITEVPGGFWALDHAEIRAAARTSDLRVNLTAPSLDHEAPPVRAQDDRGLQEDFPVRAQVQNVGFTAQEGPFKVNFTIEQGGELVQEKTVTAQVDRLGFMDTTTVQLNLTPVGSAPYSIQAEIASKHPDERPTNDVDADMLPVGVDDSVDLEVRPESSVVEPGKLLSTTVIAEPRGNVPVNETLTLTAYPYDPTTQLPIGDGAIELGQERVQLPRDADKHPAGIEGAVETVEFTRTLTKGAYLLVAELGESTAQTPLGVGTPPPPILSEDFDQIAPGPASFSLEAGSGEWTVRPDSDVSPVPRRIDPGSVENGSAWVPLSHESTVLRPQDGENITSGSVAAPDAGACVPGAFILAQLSEDTRCAAKSEGRRLGTPLVLESPEGTQRVHAMATEVPLHDASEAKLEYLSSLLPPKDGSGTSEARVYVATDHDIRSMTDQLTNPENCPQVTESLQDQGVENPTNVGVRPCRTASMIAQNLEQPIVSLFGFEEYVRCDVTASADALLPGNDTTKGQTCPGRGGSGSGSGACSDVDDAGGRLCRANEPTQLAALAPMLSGTLVDRHTSPHTWERSTVNLDPWAGQNVTIGIVYIGESHEAEQSFNFEPKGTIPGITTNLRDSAAASVIDPLSGTLGYDAPGRSEGAFLASRVQVQTDEGIKLEAENTERIQNRVVNSAQTARMGYATQGWNTVGYDHVTGLGDAETPLRTSAQLLTGNGDPVAEGAQDGDGLLLGTREETRVGVKLFPRRLYTNFDDNYHHRNDGMGGMPSNADDPAVTVLASPKIDLSGTDNPQLRFRQKFDLTSVTDGNEYEQLITDELQHTDISSSLGLPSNVTKPDECDLGSRARSSMNLVALEGLRCLLEEKRNRDADFNVQNDVLRSSVAEPGVSAGLYVRAQPIDGGAGSDTEVVKPVDGYRYPIDDPGGYEPTLDYTVVSPDAFPGYTTGQSLSSARSLTEQSTYKEIREPSFAGTPVWAGSSDTSDPDESSDWITSKLDLSPWAGQEIKLEFVLVARQNHTVMQDAQKPGTTLTKEPWALDDMEVVESEVEGEAEIEKLRWPSKKLPVATPDTDLPVRATVSTPTGLDKPVHGKAVLVDSEGCVRGSDHVKAQYENEAGRVEPMPPGAELKLPDMVIPGENVDGATPWDIRVGVDVGQEPSVLAPSSINTRPIRGNASEISATGALNVSGGASIEMIAQDPNCDPSVDITTVLPQGASPVVESDERSSRDLTFEIDTADKSQLDENDDRCKGDRLRGDTFRSFEVSGQCAPMLLAVSEGEGSDAGGTSLLLSSDHTAEGRTALVDAPQRIPVGSPTEIEVDVPRDLTDATLWAVDTSADDPQAEPIWPPGGPGQQRSIRATEDTTIPITLDEAGPKLLVLTGESEDHASTIGGTMVVASDAKSAGDPTQIDNKAELTAIAGEREQLSVKNVEVTPSSALSTTPRTVEAEVQNTGTTTLHNVTAKFQAEGNEIATKSRDILRAGETATFTLPEFNPGSEPSVVIRVDATSDEGLSASGATPARSLVKLGSLTPIEGESSDGWQVEGESAHFQNPDTEQAPKDTQGSVELVRQPHRPEEGARMEGLAGVAVQLDHRLDMEERFDGGQVILSNGTSTKPLSVGEATKKMGPYSPVAGQALTGLRENSAETIKLNTSNAETETLVDKTAVEALGYPLLTDDPEEQPDGKGLVDCASRTFTDDQIDVERQEPYCAHSQPTVPTPSTAMSRGVFYLQPASFLSAENNWTVDEGTKSYDVTVNEATSYVFLEAGRDLVSSAQEEGKLEIRFDEARKLDPFFSARERPMSVEVCARFMGVHDESQDDNTPPPPVIRRCTGLNHEESGDQLLEKPWSSTILTIGNIPESTDNQDPYNVVRLELSLEMDRRATRGTGLMSEDKDKKQYQDTQEAIGLEEPVKGWFVGPVTATAGETEETWTPDEQALTRTDPNTGLRLSQLEKAVENKATDNPAGSRLTDQVDQSAVLALTDVKVNGPGGPVTTSTVSGLEGTGHSEMPTIDVPLTPCPWHKAGSCAWTDIVKTYMDTRWSATSATTRALATAPFAMNLTCSQPSPYDLQVRLQSTTGCDSSADLPGMGVQVLDSSTIDRGTSNTCGDVEVGPPVLWRTRCLSAKVKGDSLEFRNVPPAGTTDGRVDFDVETEGPRSIEVSWTPEDEDNPRTVQVYRCKQTKPIDCVSSDEFAPVGTSNDGDFVDEELSVEADYCYQAVVKGSEAATDRESILCASPGGRPHAPAGLDVRPPRDSADSTQQLLVEWDTATPGFRPDVDTWKIARCSVEDRHDCGSLGDTIAEQGQTSFTDDLEDADQAYCYRVWGYNGSTQLHSEPAVDCGISDTSSDAPQGLFVERERNPSPVPNSEETRITLVSGANLTASWVYPSEEGSAQANRTDFTIERCKLSENDCWQDGAAFEQANDQPDEAYRPDENGQRNEWRFVDDDPRHSETWCYRVATASADGQAASPRSNVDCETTVEPPSKPRDLTVTRASSVGRIDVSWEAPADDGGDKIDGYTVERCTLGETTMEALEACGTETEWVRVGTFDKPKDGYQEQAFVPGSGPYCYRVTADNTNTPNERGEAAIDCGMAKEGSEDTTPIRSRGHSLDYRLVVPVDLRFAADNAQVSAKPIFENMNSQSLETNFDLPVNVRAQARIQGQDTWQDVPQCRDAHGDCSVGWQLLGDDADRLDLSAFVGQQIELAFRIQQAHPGLTLLEKDPAFKLKGLTVDAGYLRLIDLDMQMRAWTDPSVQGDGWNVRGVELFGLPIKANVGLNELDSKALVGDQLHVHAKESAESDVFMSAPVNITVYNQGTSTETIPLEATLQAGTDTNPGGTLDEGIYSTSDAWTSGGGISAPAECEVEIKPGEVELEPGQSRDVSARVNFVPEDENGRLDPDEIEVDSTNDMPLAACFPGQFDSNDNTDTDDAKRSDLRFQLRVNASETPEDDYVASDDELVQRVRPNPFLTGRDNDRRHQPGLDITAFDIHPTRPAPGQPVRVSANVSLVDSSDRGADIQLTFVDPESGKVLRSLSGTDADTPITTFEPYQTTSLNWTLADPPDQETLVRLSAEITRNGDSVTDNRTGWLADDSVDEHVQAYAPFMGLRGGGDTRSTVRNNETIMTTRDRSGGRIAITGDTFRDTGRNYQELEAIVGTDWIQLEDSPPPLLGIRARWNFDGTDQHSANPNTPGDAKKGHQVADGWAVQVCHVPRQPDGDECPLSTQRSGDSRTDNGWAWRTVNVHRAPDDTLAEVANPNLFQRPGQCKGIVQQATDPSLPSADDFTGQRSGNQQTMGSGPPCSSINAQWSNMGQGEDILTNTSPGYSRPLNEEGAFRTVIASGTDCPEKVSFPGSGQCPLDWNGTGETADRHDFLRYRIVAVGTDSTRNTDFTISDLTIAPVGVEGSPRQSTGGFPIPEEAPKAVPMNLDSLGAIGTKIDTRIDEPQGWDVSMDGLPSTNAVEEGIQPRLLVEAPISPSGISQSATLTPTFDVQAEPLRSIETIVPIGVRAGQHPDLAVQDVELTDDVKEGDETLVQVRVKNVGFETSEEVEVTGAARYDDGQVNLLEPPKDKERVTLPPLPPGVEETVVLKWTPSESGNATIRVGADLTRAEPLSGPVLSPWDGGQMPELKECSDADCNNVGTQRVDVVPPREADTSVDVQVLADTPLVVGEPVDVRITVRNDGPATVPAYEVRLLAGVVSLLEEDPLRVTEPLAPGETWTRTVQMIPGFGGDLDLVGQVTADESLVRELRGLKAGGGTYDEDNVDDQRVPVVARGLSIDTPRAVRGDQIADNGTLEVPVTLTNLGSEELDVSAAADTEAGIGTLVDENRDPIGTVNLAPGEAKNATLLLLYKNLPTAGRQPVQIDAVSKAGVERASLEVEVPERKSVGVRPVVETASAGKVKLPVTIDATGNAPVQAEVTVNAANLTSTSRSVELQPGNTSRVELPTWLDATTPSPVEGEVVVRGDTFTRKAPLRIVQDGDVMPTIENARAVGGTSPHTWVHVANLGSTAGSFNLTLAQDGETLATESVHVEGRAAENVTLDALPDPGPAHVRLESPATDTSINWTMDVPDLQPDVRVLHARLDPVSPEAGEDVQVQATIANEGGSAVDLRPGLFVDGVLHTVSSQEYTVEPGSVTSVTFEWTAESGAHTVSVSADPQDRIDDVQASDDAIARDVEIQSGGATGPMNVDFLPASPLAALALLAAAAWLRRDRSG